MADMMIRAIKIARCIRFVFNKRVKLGCKVKIGKHVDIKAGKQSAIVIGNHCYVSDYDYISCVKGCINIGDNCSLNRNVMMVAHEKIVIGDSCRLGPGVTIYDHDHKFGENGLCDGYKVSEVVIGRNCWIGANVTILRGTHIGNNVVIGAGCIISGEIPDNMLVTSDRNLKFAQLIKK